MNLLVTGAWTGAKESIHQIKKMGNNICFMQYETDEIPCAYDWVEGVICNGLFLSHSIDKFVNLRYIQLTSAGFDRVPMDYITEHGIKINNAKGVYSIPMAEYSIAGVLQLYKQMQFFKDNQRKHKWEKNRGLIELCGKTVCIVGCGSVGTECAKRYRAFDCNIVGVDLFTRQDENYDTMVLLNELDIVLPEADILILTLPLTEETKHLISDEKLLLLKESAIVVNISRGAIIDMNALIKHMHRLGGAVLDVFEEEPLNEDSPFWEMEHIILTPHNSFVGKGNRNRLNDVILKNLEKR